MLLCCLQEECRYSEQVKGSCEALSQQVAVLEDSLGTANSAHRAAEAKLSSLGTRLQVCLALLLYCLLHRCGMRHFPKTACLLAPVAYQRRRAMQSDGQGAF